MVDEAQPAARMLQKYVQPLFERFALALAKHVFGFEFLVDGQVDGVVGVRYAERRRRLGRASRVVRTGDRGRGRRRRVVPARTVEPLLETDVAARSLPLHGRRHPAVVPLAEPRCASRARARRIPARLRRSRRRARILLRHVAYKKPLKVGLY